MMVHPDVWLAMAHDRQYELIEEAERGRLLAVALRVRRQRRAHKERARGAPAGTLASCDPPAAVPAQ